MAKRNKRKNSSTREPLEREIPFEPEEEVEQPRTTYRAVLAYILDQDEVNMLIEASNPTVVEPTPPNLDLDYPTYSKDECIALTCGTYHPRKLNKKK